MQPVIGVTPLMDTKLDSYWCDFEGTKVTLQDMIEGYLSHLHLHIHEIHELMNA